ncbi:hypothetical protein V1517DRAFT_332350 [Lipomyces orientalis]|uniref:Uncharacterized protein n=1 Tax=Lipomyces orientalis TaxID=1233043 RepID=A0ACC3TF54_9ASCO
MLPYLRLDLIQWPRRYYPDHLAFCILLRGLAYPERWNSMMNDFGRSQSYLCSVTRDVVLHLVRRYGDKLKFDYRRLALATLLRYAGIVEKKCRHPNV